MKSAKLSPDVLRGRWYSLVPLTPEFHGAIYELAFRDQNVFRWRYRGTQPTAAAFEQSLYNGVLCQFVICPNDTRAFSGLVVAYNASPQDEFCCLAAITDQTASTGAVEGIALFLRYLFRHWPLRKIYLESVEFNAPQFASAVDAGLFKEEGRLKDHHYFDGTFWDLITYAIYREDTVEYLDLNSLLPPEEGAK